ncbi:hypothetical protein O6H91_21G012900 [Diphasiastrum complanatum]|uniref:Uncharacterized protein n=1 Tax=Diphasiastrum complanatum TaxID=34168 RepID=A0ACC2AI08_DIPCM|nr:hypothetical protein O6H91_21G012900 [Diphasiastrum complanatum]
MEPHERSRMAIPRFPVATTQLSSIIEDTRTEFMLCSYDDAVLVIVTQLGKLGTILHARKEQVHSGTSTFNVNVLMGKRDEPILVACARQIIEHMSNSGSSRSLVLSLGLKNHSPVTLRGIIDVIISNKVW